VHNGRGVDVLVITALKDEYDAARAAVGASRWLDHKAGSAEPYATVGHEGLSIALARPTQMGGRGVSAITTTLVNELRPTCLAMCGVCAGKPGETAPGDVIIASPAYEWDEGKHVGQVFRADHQQFPQDIRWLRAAQDFRPTNLPTYGVATDEEATVWFLERLYKDQNPRKHPARHRYLPGPAWREQLGRLESGGLIRWQDGELVLTDHGRDHVQRVLYFDVGPERLPYEVVTGPMASGSAVMSDPEVWNRLEINQRRILALEMEAATITTVAHERQVPHWLVAKGVMDHADFAKDDRFKAFAARASADVLFALLTQLLSTAAPEPRPVPQAVDIPGLVKREVIRRLTYDWQDLADVVGVPSYETRRFRSGDESRDLWTWLENRNRLPELPGALAAIGRTDLADLLRPYR
jgi:nucleoside phosphorylase